MALELPSPPIPGKEIPFSWFTWFKILYKIISDMRNGIKVREGANAKQGTVTLVAGNATVNNNTITANSRIFLTTNVPGGAPGYLLVSARTAGVSFSIFSSSVTDTSTVAYEIFEPLT